MTRSRAPFTGTLQQLEKLIVAARVAGQWRFLPAGFWQFRCESGGILNWWPTTGTINFQGPEYAAEELERSLSEVAAYAQLAPPRLSITGNR